MSNSEGSPRAARRRVLTAAVLALLLAPAAPAAPPLIPDTLTYQGVLLDNLGDPQTGTVDLTLRVWDSAIFGVLVYTQGFTGVPLTDGVFSVELGPTGAATDTPTNPLTTSLATALAGDPGTTAPRRYLEVTVGAGGAMGRTQILTVPYAMRASSADTASGVSGIPGSFISELFEHGNSDGSGPANSDPSEGLGDTDNDGIANFVDPDNDNDQLSDSFEVAQGSDINLVTPVINAIVPSTADSFVTTNVGILGSNFDPGVSVVFGSQTPTPTSVTPSSIGVNVGPQPPGTVNVVVTNPNGESDSTTFDFFLRVPTITGFSPASAPAFTPVTITVTGTDFDPAMTVSFGSENPTPQNVTGFSFDVDIVSQPPSLANVVVTHPNGETGMATYAFEAVDGDDHGVATGTRTQLSFGVEGGLRALVSGLAEYGVDTDPNGIPDTIVPFATQESHAAGAIDQGQMAVAWNPAGELVGLRCCDIEVITDSDADFDLEDETGLVIDSGFSGFARMWSPSLAFDTSGPSAKLVAGYVRLDFGGTAKVAHDRDGNGDFLGTNELVSLDTGLSSGNSASDLGRVAVDATGRVAYVYHRRTATLSDIRVAYDRSGDGDYDDSPSGNPELATLATGQPHCLGAAFDPNDDLAVVYAMPGSGPVLAIDKDGDGLFTGAGETASLPGGPTVACDVAGGAVLAVAHNADGDVRLLIDRNNDGDFTDAAQFEDQVLQTAGAGGSGVETLKTTLSGTGQVWLTTDSKLWVDPASP